MENYNQTSTDFILLGLFPLSRIGTFLFILIVLIFLMALFGNLSMILLIFMDIHLHKPMYFLLSQLSLIDLNYISTIVPKMAYNFLFGNKSISFIGCGVQSFFFLTLAGAEALLLASMAYDRYVAICFPLHYSIRISRRVCVLMIMGSWIMGSINSCAHTTYALHIPYCQPGPSIISSVMSQPCWLWPVWTPGSMSTQCLWAPPYSLCCLLLSLHVPMAVFSLLSFTWTQQKGGRRPIRPAAPISLLWLSTMPPFFTPTYAQDLIDLQQGTRLWLCFTPSWPQCSTLLSIAWETRRWWRPWEE